MSPSRHRGMTLVEMMVAMAIGTILIGGAITVYIESRSSFRTADSLARLQENVRFALDSLEPDIQLARYWGRTNVPALINTAGIVVSCTGATNLEATTFAMRVNAPVEARDDNYDLDCTGNNPRADTDVLVLRHAGARDTSAELTVGRVQVESNINGGDLFDDAVLPGRENGVVRDVVVNAYYIGESTFDANVPALRRLTLVDGGASGRLDDQEVIPGVENLQVQFGLDTTGNRQVDRYVDGDHPLAAPGAAARVIAVRLWLLVRSETDETGQGFRDNRVYQPADADLAPIQPGVTDGYPDTFRRVAVSKTIFLRNSVGGAEDV